jgi:hypothetical protein
MSLSEIASVATAVTGLAVTVSLIYVAFQTRQSVRHTRTLIQQRTAAIKWGASALFLPAR